MKLKLLFFFLCFSITQVTFSQTANPVNDLHFCDDNNDGDSTNGFVQNINLDIQTPQALGSQSPTDFMVTYHISLSDAQAGVNSLNSPYTNTIAHLQTIYIRVTEDTSSNFNTTNFDIVVNPLPVINTIVELKQCDNNTDGISNFNLTEANSLISNDAANQNFSYYHTMADATSDINLIANPSAYTNITVTTDTVWARVINSNGCYRIAQIDLVVSTTSIPSSFSRTFNVCDDFLDINGIDNANNDDTDGVTTFDFSSVDADVRAMFPPTQQLTITYYRNSADALAELNAITDISNYRNIGYPNIQSIYIRVDSDLDNGCLGLGPYITLNVDPAPLNNFIPDYEVCDDGNDGSATNGIIQTFDLEIQTTHILGTQNPSDFTVSYHLTENDANTGNSPLASSPFTNTVAGRQIIFVRVINNATGCYNDQMKFDLIVNDCADPDNDGVINSKEDLNNNGDLNDDDTDNNMTPNFMDNDDDGDGVLTIDEDYNNNGDPTDDDTNTNGIPDYLESAVALSVDSEQNIHFSLYPNPTNTQLNIKFNNNVYTSLKISIYNLNGQTVLKKQFSGNNTIENIDVSTIVNGIYFIKIDSDHNSQVKKLIISHNY